MHSNTASGKNLADQRLFRLQGDSFQNLLPQSFFLLLAFNNIEIGVLLELLVKLRYKIFLQFLLSLLADIDVDVTVLFEHWLTLGEHHHGTHRKVFKLILPQQTLGSQDEEDPDASDYGSQRRPETAGVSSVESVAHQVGPGRALHKHSGVEGGVHHIVPDGRAGVVSNVKPDVTLLHEVLPETDLAGAPDCEAAEEPQGGVGVLTVPPGTAVDQVPVTGSIRVVY